MNMRTIRQGIVFFVAGLLVWLCLTWPPSMGESLLGAFVGLAVAVLVLRYAPVDFHPRHSLPCLLYAVWYILVFVWECFKANIDVAWRVLHPRMPIRPGIVRVKTRLRSPLARTVLANSITLTPGTLTVDIDEDGGWLYVHWIKVKNAETEAATKMIVARFERILGKICHE